MQEIHLKSALFWNGRCHLLARNKPLRLDFNKLGVKIEHETLFLSLTGLFGYDDHLQLTFIQHPFIAALSRAL